MATDRPSARLLANAVYRAMAALGQRNGIRQRAIPHYPSRLNTRQTQNSLDGTNHQGCLIFIPDEWGKSSDLGAATEKAMFY